MVKVSIRLALLAAALSGCLASLASAADGKRPIDAALARFGPQAPSERKPSPKIVGGELAKPGRFPFQVALIAHAAKEGDEQRGQFCGGSLIANNWVLTAAHCVPDTAPEEVDVYIGSTVLPTGGSAAGSSPGVRRAVKQVVRHQAYAPSTSDNDIALLLLAEVAPDQLATAIVATPGIASEHGGVGDKATVIGWGGTEEGGSTTPRLREAEVTVQESALCETNYDEALQNVPGTGEPTITGNMFCAGRPEGGVDSCQGDSGGFIGAPLADGRWTQLGVVSWGIGCARPELFGVYTRVANYEAWILEIQRNF